MEIAELLTMKDVCKVLKVTDDTIYKEIKEGKMAATLIRGKWRITQENFEQYIKSRTIKIKKIA